MVIADFRAEFPEFSSTVNYPDAQLNFYAGIAETLCLESVWTTMLPYAVKLYVAHEITLAYQSLKTSNQGGVPGQNSGIANNKTVGSVSVGYDASQVAEKDAGWWNLTNYGRQFYRLAQMFGAGCVQLGAPICGWPCP